MKIGFARFENTEPYATVEPREDTLETYAKDLADNSSGKELALDFFSEAPPKENTNAVNFLASLDALVATSDNFRDGLEWFLGRIYTTGVERGRKDILDNPLAEKIRGQLTSMSF